MKWIKNKQKYKKIDWRLWFAWKPVVVFNHPDGNEEKVWGETILRRSVYDTSGVMKGISGFWRYEYKYRPEQPNVPDKPTTFPLPSPPRQKGVRGNGELESPEPLVECQHKNGTIEKMGGDVCIDCSKVIRACNDRLTIPAKIQEPDYMLNETEHDDDYTGQKWIPIGEFTEEDHKELEQRTLEANPLDMIDQAEETWGPEVIKEYDVEEDLLRATMTPWKPKHDWKDCNGCEDCIEGWTKEDTYNKHEIDISWEVKRARRNKTIM